MKQKQLKIGSIPAILWGEPSEKLYLYIHGQNGNKEEAEAFSKIICLKGWQVLSCDLPEHGERTAESDTFNPWHVVPELRRIMRYTQTNWSKIALYANSIGVWFCMLSLADEPLENCLFVSPIFDMERLITNMMKWAGVTEPQLKKEQIIPTNFGQTLSWKYLEYTRKNPIIKWAIPTSILYADKDNLTEYCVIDDFVKRFHCRLTVMENGEHWFHTPEQLAVLEQWIKNNY